MGGWGDGVMVRPFQPPSSFFLVSMPDVGRISQQRRTHAGGEGGQEGGVVKAGESKVGPVDTAETHSPAT